MAQNKKPRDIDFHTKVETSVNNYFYGIPVEGNAIKKKKWMGVWPEADLEFAGRVILKGNILSLINIEGRIDEKTFWDQSIFYQLVTASFWTFNPIFRSKLTRAVETFPHESAIVLYKLLDKNFLPYLSDQVISSGEYIWAKDKKMPNLLNDPEFAKVFEWDYKNRLDIKLALKKHIVGILRKEKKPKEAIVADKTENVPVPLDVIESVKKENTELEIPAKRSNIILDPALFLRLFKSDEHFAAFIDVTTKAGYRQLLEKAPKNKKGTPTYFNLLSCLLVRLFDDAGYFKNNDLIGTTKAFLGYSHNHITERFSYYFNQATNNKKNGQPEEILNFTYLITEGIKHYGTIS